MGVILTGDSIQEAVGKMSEGNRGAIAAMVEIIKGHELIDGGDPMGGVGDLMVLDAAEIYGTGIYILWNDKCGQDLRKLLILLRAVRLGFLDGAKLKEMADDQTRQINLTTEEMADLDAKVCEAQPSFARP